MSYRNQLQTLLGSTEPSLNAYVESIRERAEREGLPIALYGIGKWGKLWLQYFLECKIEVAFLADQSRRGTEEGIEILSLPTLAERTQGNVMLVVTPWTINESEESRAAFAGSTKESSLKNMEFIPTRMSHALELQKLDQASIEKALSMLDDSLSKYSYYEYLRSRIGGERFRPPYFGQEQQYLANELFMLNERDYIVDCGAYTGDTVELFARYYPFLRGITAFEPTMEIFQILQETARKTNVPVEAIPMATGGAAYKAALIKRGSDQSGNSVLTGSALEDDACTIAVCTLDATVADKHPTFIKMDIEGSELEALRGSINIIRAEFPILAICIYHKAEDLYTIPFFIKECHPEYRLFVRKYGNKEHQELVLFAVPPHRLLADND